MEVAGIWNLLSHNHDFAIESDLEGKSLWRKRFMQVYEMSNCAGATESVQK